jgi:hypothetical protein
MAARQQLDAQLSENNVVQEVCIYIILHLCERNPLKKTIIQCRLPSGTIHIITTSNQSLRLAPQALGATISIISNVHFL